nr:GDP-mannose 4,6-dehydratase [Actinomycetota bacterium]
IREFAELVFKELNMELEWKGKGIDEKGIERRNGKTLVKVNPNYFRLTEVDLLIGDASKAKEKLGWEPEIKFAELAKIMAKADWEKVKKRGY